MEFRSSPTDAELPHTGAETSSAEPLQHEHDAVTADDSSVLGQDKLSVPSSSTLAERPVGATETLPRAAAVLPQIPFALSSAQVPFENATVMLQMPSRGTGTIKWDPPRPGTPEPSDAEGAAVSLTDDAGQLAPLSIAPVPAPLPAPIAKTKPGQHPSDHSYATTLEIKDDLEPALESADRTTAEHIPRPSKAEAQAAAIAEAISAAAAAAGKLHLHFQVFQTSMLTLLWLYGGINIIQNHLSCKSCVTLKDLHGRPRRTPAMRNCRAPPKMNGRCGLAGWLNSCAGAWISCGRRTSSLKRSCAAQTAGSQVALL